MEIQTNKRKWKSRKNKNYDSAEDAETQCNNLFQLLYQKAPKLTPKIIPRGFDDDNLKNLCRTTKQQEDLENFVKNNFSGQCSICLISKTLHLDTVWSLDFSSSAYKLEKIQFICNRCKKARDVENFVSSSVSESIIQHFIAINYGPNPVIKVSARDYSNELEIILSSDEDSDEDEKSKKKKQQSKDNCMDDEPTNEFYNTDGVLYAEVNQVYSIAYALKVLASNMQSLQVVDMHGNVFSEKTDIAALLQSVQVPSKPVQQEEKKKKKKKKTKMQEPSNNTTNDEPKSTVKQTVVEKKKPEANSNQNGKQKAIVKELVTNASQEINHTKKQNQDVTSNKPKQVAFLKKKLKAKKSA